MKNLPVGGHTNDCTHVLKDRIETIFQDESGYTALRSPLRQESGAGSSSVRVPQVVSGWPDPGVRDVPQLPFICVRPTGGGQAKDDEGNPCRVATFLVLIGVHCDEMLDYEYAIVILERIWRNLAERPYLANGRYIIQKDSIEWAENAELMKAYPAHVVGMNIPVTLPTFLQTEDMNGNPIRWEDGYPNP